MGIVFSALPCHIIFPTCYMVYPNAGIVCNPLPVGAVFKYTFSVDVRLSISTIAFPFSLTACPEFLLYHDLMKQFEAPAFSV